MLYEDAIEKMKERMREMDPEYKMNKVVNNLSTGGKLERRFKQKVGRKINKDPFKKFNKLYAYDVVSKIYKKIENMTQK